MKKILNTSLASIIAAAYLLSFSGCVDDRALFNVKDINESGNVTPLDPNGDEDGDGLTNGEEDDIGTNPLDPDTDGDGLDDGLEVKIIGTNPLSSDSDKDGVTDGIEVVGTYESDINTDGKVITANGTPIKDGTLDIAAPISIKDWGEKTPANIHKNSLTDPGDKIDALDPMNDSDYDKRPNKIETEKKTDPLDQKSFYPWIYETPQGIVMEQNGFIYVPAINGDGGFWMSSYEARPVNIIATPTIDFPAIVQKYFKMITGETPSGFTTANPSGTTLSTINFINTLNSVVGIYGFEAAYMLDNSQIANTWAIGLPSIKQYTHVIKLLSSNEIGNSIVYYDPQVEEYYTRNIYELQSGVKEFTNTIVNLPYLETKIDGMDVRENPEGLAYAGSTINNTVGLVSKTALAIIGNGFIDLRYSISYADNGDFAIGFRAASDYIK